MSAPSTIRRASLERQSPTARVLVSVFFNGPVPPIVGYWWMN